MTDFRAFPRTKLEAWIVDARSRTLGLVRDLSDEAFLHVPLLRTINPFLWEIGHVAYFQEYWVLRHARGRAPLLPDGDAWYDSAKVSHDTRWNLPLPSRASTIDYLEATRDAALEVVAASDLNEHDIYFILLAVFHEDMHDEAFTITRQALGYPAPAFSGAATSPHAASSDEELCDAMVPGGTYVIGSGSEDGFIFDNEKWAHPVVLKDFQIARVPVTQSQFLAFVGDDGYSRRDLWTPEGWAWREKEHARCPIYWSRTATWEWKRRHFDRWVPLEPHHPVANICWFEADAYCRWAGRRLPTEFEWEVAALGIPERASANLDWSMGGCCDVGGHPSGESAVGCRQMIGNVWEWTASDFLPYPGFSEDSYKEYSSPWFGSHKTLRGGAWSTRSRLIKPAYRNFYTPDRRDIWAGFRTCAPQS